MRTAGVLAVAGVLGVAVGVLAAVGAAKRLDRLHVRTDAAWVALDAALGRRTQAVSGLGAGSAAGQALPRRTLPGWDVVSATAEAGLAVREDAENELGRVLAVLDRSGLDPAGAARLADAEQRLVIARRVYNDAVRDTLALRSQRVVRWLRLAGTAPLPHYFEIAEPGLSG